MRRRSPRSENRDGRGREGVEHTPPSLNKYIFLLGFCLHALLSSLNIDILHLAYSWPDLSVKQQQIIHSPPLALPTCLIPCGW